MTLPTSTSAVIASILRAAWAPSALTEEILIEPSSSISITVPVSSCSARITAPPLPITSRIFSGLIFMLIMRGAYSDIWPRLVPEGLLHEAEDVQAGGLGLLQRPA